MKKTIFSIVKVCAFVALIVFAIRDFSRGVAIFSKPAADFSNVDHVLSLEKSFEQNRRYFYETCKSVVSNEDKTKKAMILYDLLDKLFSDGGFSLEETIHAYARRQTISDYEIASGVIFLIQLHSINHEIGAYSSEINEELRIVAEKAGGAGFSRSSHSDYDLSQRRVEPQVESGAREVSVDNIDVFAGKWHTLSRNAARVTGNIVFERRSSVYVIFEKHGISLPLELASPVMMYENGSISAVFRCGYTCELTGEDGASKISFNWAKMTFGDPTNTGNSDLKMEVFNQTDMPSFNTINTEGVVGDFFYCREGM